MSYDIELEINTGNEFFSVETIRNCTYNNFKIFKFALNNENGINEFQGKLCKDILEPLSKGFLKLIDFKYRQEFLALEPENRWGGYSDSLDFFIDFLKKAHAHPEATINIH